jgi:methionyl-tRNA synthetase
MAAVKPTITFEEFSKLDIRIAKVLEASDHPNADKLICMKIDLGDEQRQIIAGLRPFCTAQALVGKEIVVVANMAPRKMRGLESNGMLLAATVGGENLQDVVVLMPERQVPPGSPVS